MRQAVFGSDTSERWYFSLGISGVIPKNRGGKRKTNTQDNQLAQNESGTWLHKLFKTDFNDLSYCQKVLNYHVIVILKVALLSLK
jgi:hypothetical protein